MAVPAAAGWAAGIHTSGSNSPTLITSSPAGRAPAAGRSQPSPASARRWPIAENSASSAISIHTTSAPAAAAVARSREAAATASASGR